MPGTPAKLVTYVPRPLPTLGNNEQLYLQQELAAISNAITVLTAAIRAVEARLVSGGL
jgi:hypothetical protein